MYTLAISKFDIPGDPGFPLNSVYAKPISSTEAGECFVTMLNTDVEGKVKLCLSLIKHHTMKMYGACRTVPV
jgi:hypothetical protein